MGDVVKYVARIHMKDSAAFHHSQWKGTEVGLALLSPGEPWLPGLQGSLFPLRELMNDFLSKGPPYWSREVVFTLGLNRVPQGVPPFQGKKGVPLALLCLWHPQNLYVDQFSLPEFQRFRLHFLKKASREILETTGPSFFFEMSPFYSLFPSSLRPTFQFFMVCQRSLRIAAPFSATSSFWPRDVNHAGWESTRDARALDSWLPLLLTTSCTGFRIESFLPAGEAEGQDPAALFSLSSVIITHLAPKQRGYVFLVLLPPITEKPFHCLRMLPRTRRPGF